MGKNEKTLPTKKKNLNGNKIFFMVEVTQTPKTGVWF
jgi:hypothetical protein